MTDLKTSSDLVPTARREGESLIVSVRGDIDLHNSTELRTEVLDLLARSQPDPPRRLVFNLAHVAYMDSSAVAVLVESMQKMRKAGGRVYLTDLQPRVKGLLEIARLGTIFVITKDEAEALR